MHLEMVPALDQLVLFGRAEQQQQQQQQLGQGQQWQPMVRTARLYVSVGSNIPSWPPTSNNTPRPQPRKTQAPLRLRTTHFLPNFVKLVATQEAKLEGMKRAEQRKVRFVSFCFVGGKSQEFAGDWGLYGYTCVCGGCVHPLAHAPKINNIRSPQPNQLTDIHTHAPP